MTGVFCLLQASQLVLLVSVGAALNLEACNSSLGLGSGEIPDEALSASSSHDETSVGPQNARLGKDLLGGAWCPHEPISDESYEYLEVALPRLHVVTGVATQGRFGNGHGKEFAEEYRLEYQREDAWVRYRDRRGVEVITGNSNTYTVERRALEPPIIANRVRIIPHSCHPRVVCLRAELFGCNWTEGVLWYEMPEGDAENLADTTYDGSREAGRLWGGLGALTDGVRPADGESGWVGWRNASRRHVTLTFAFDTVRNFSSAFFFTSNARSRDVQVFASARVWFSVGGRYFHREPPVLFDYVPDLFFERARNVSVNLRHRVGRFVKLELTFAARWMLLSEVSFVSVAAPGNFTDEEAPAAPPIVSTALSEDSLSAQSVGLVIGVLAAVILLLILAIFVLVARNRRRRLKAAGCSPHKSDRVTINMKDLDLGYSPPLLTNGGNLYGLDCSDPEKLLYQDPLDYKIYSYTNGHVSSADSATSREYAVPDITKVSRHYAATDVVATTYAVPDGGGDSVVRDVPRHRLHVLEKLGEGSFGEVHVCAPLPDLGGEEPLVVKTLRAGATDAARSAFLREAAALSRLKDPRLARVVAISAVDPACVVLEHCELGDLCQFLRKHSQPGLLSYGAQIYLATQVAAGMKYLESLQFVHRDLAARNCLVGRNLAVKICDLGELQERYARDYYGRLPIRWMAWESIILNKFSPKSDVWAFAVTLWEILTLCRHQPHAELSDEQVLENAGRLRHGSRHFVVPSQPSGCPREIYDLMTECWQRLDSDRPQFREIHLFLQRKNIGFAP